MADYSRQILAVSAAASMNGDGSSPITYGCSITRISTGIYKLILPTGEGVTDGQSFTQVTLKPFVSTPNPTWHDNAMASVSDESEYIKSIIIQNIRTDSPDTIIGVLADKGVEVIVQRATVNPQG